MTWWRKAATTTATYVPVPDPFDFAPSAIQAVRLLTPHQFNVETRYDVRDRSYEAIFWLREWAGTELRPPRTSFSARYRPRMSEKDVVQATVAAFNAWEHEQSCVGCRHYAELEVARASG